MKTRTNFQGVAALSGQWALGLSATLLSATSFAQVNLAQSPLFINAAVTPTVLMAMDDSGSMDAEILLKTNDGAAWWHTGNDSFVGLGRLDVAEAGRPNYNEVGGASATWKKYIYLFPNGDGGNGAGQRAYGDGNGGNDHFAVPPLPAYAYTRSPDFNFSYFNPSVTYAPWPSEGGWTFGNVSPTAAPTDATRGTVTVNLTVETESTAANHVFRLYQGMSVPAGVRNAPRNGTWGTAAYTATDANTDANHRAISYFPAQFYLRAATALPSCYGYLGTAVTTSGRGPDGTTVLNGYQIRPDNFTDACGRTAAQNYQTAIQNFANWFTYYRKRHAAARNALGSGFESFRDFRVGLYRIGNLPSPATALPIRDLFDNTQRTAFFNQAYTEISSGGTPNRQAVNAMRAQLARTDANAPIRLECQKNFGVLITDGFSDPNTGSGVGNRDGDMGAPFADDHSNTMADIGAALFRDNPRPLLPTGRVPVPRECTLASVPLDIDCNPNLHLNLFGISLGAPGNIYGVNEAATADPYTNPPAWPNPTATRSPQQIDDLWHATLNSRGEFLSVERPSDLGESFRRVLDSIRARVDASGSSAAASSAVLQANTRLYNASFRSTDWSGNLVGTALNANGTPGAEAWNAEAILSARNLATHPRAIFTSTEAGAAVALNFADLSAAQRAALEVNPIEPASPTATGAQRVEWLKGIDQADLRSRLVGTDRRLLGDIIGSDPQFMSQRDFGYVLLPGAEGTAYRAFRESSAYIGRTDMLFVGSNGGMLHAFDATSPPPETPTAATPTAGREMFAYVPSELLMPGVSGAHARINDLMRPDYQHRFYVDGSAVVSDAYVNGNWRTMLVGTMGAGGRTVFALDVTNPAAFTASDVKWEFKYAANACVADPTGAAGSRACNAVGYGITKPKIVRLATGRWAAVFGNGFNSAGHSARLLVVDMQTGRLLYNLEAVDAANPASANTNASPNGLSPVQTTDWPSNQLSLTNAYAGDLKGNLWRFNFASIAADPTSSPVVTRLFTATDNAVPARRQPITAMPELALRPGSISQLVVVFGTGSFFREGDDDMVNPQLQTLYGIFDNASPAVTDVTRAQLLEQTISANAATVTVGTESYAPGSLRFVTDNELTDEPGWRMDLPVSGERVISEATFPSGSQQERVRFTTLIPDNNPCGVGRSGFIMDISLLSGGRFSGSVFDLSDDGVVNVSDLVGNIPVSGLGGTTGERLTIIRGDGVDNLYSGEGELETRGSNTSGPVGRQSWRQLR